MAKAGVDTTVLYAAGNENSQRHERGFDLVQAADRRELPELLVPDVVLVETMNGLTRDVGHETATDMLDRLETSTGFDIERVPNSIWHAGIGMFRSVERLSLADGIIAAFLRERDVEYLYSFDGGFDGLDGITRLGSTTNPYGPE